MAYKDKKKSILFSLKVHLGLFFFISLTLLSKLKASIYLSSMKINLIFYAEILLFNLFIPPSVIPPLSFLLSDCLLFPCIIAIG